MGRQPCCTRKGCAMELSIPASPSRLAGLRRAARVYLRGVAEEVADDVVLALDGAATNAVLYGSSGDQPIQVVVQVNDDWVEASVLDRGPAPPAGFPAAADTDELRVGGRAASWLGYQVTSDPAAERTAVRAEPTRDVTDSGRRAGSVKIGHAGWTVSAHRLGSLAEALALP